ncbi:Hypothetical predicted protein [Mytilus galloprovincialis]|uniref:THAP-type domain-containing protein n=1 Tax=Mytilus galloprovincialis TaxID=29158 RepID=A0A8B6GSP8_MYTGA|nr:Hypothetical predicted protein [Mytilus galloprovincialis]
MPYCVVYGCNSNSQCDKNIYWFTFPKDSQRNRAWVHYCKRQDFTPSKHSRICSKHFTLNQYSRHPGRLSELGYPGAKAALKDDAMPDIPVVVDAEKGPSSPKKPREEIQNCTLYGNLQHNKRHLDENRKYALKTINLAKEKLTAIMDDGISLTKLTSDFDSLEKMCSDLKVSKKEMDERKSLFKKYITALIENIEKRFADSSDLLVAFSVDPLLVPSFKQYCVNHITTLAGHFLRKEKLTKYCLNGSH